VRELCGVYGLNYLRSVDFERRVTKDSGVGINRIDGFFPGLLLVEMKSKGKDLAEAYEQAKGYIPKLKNKEDTPRFILVSDFQNLHLYDETGEHAPIQFKLADFKSHVNDQDFLLGYERIYQQRQAAASIEAATLFHFGMLNSTMHNAWMRAVCGRLESRYRYSNTIVYNNYPWPTPSPAQQAAIETAAQAVLDARAQHPGQSLAWLYDPENLRKNKSLQAAHDAVDEAVDEAYGYEDSNDDTSRVAYLFKLYEKLALAPMLEPAETVTPVTPAKKPRKKSTPKVAKEA
jgi:hypothetical protein